VKQVDQASNAMDAISLVEHARTTKAAYITCHLPHTTVSIVNIFVVVANE
jgi:hypothetical protein